MWQLILVSIIWAFSFGLIKGHLTGIDPAVVASLRLLMCVLCFLPFVIYAKKYRPKIKLMLLGSVQFGLMYLFYITSYQYLPGYLVAVFTIFTPLYVVLINAIMVRKFSIQILLPVLLSIIGAGIIVFKDFSEQAYLFGFLLLQLANIAFACGQVGYKFIAGDGVDSENMLWMYLGAAILASSYCAYSVDLSAVSIKPKQWLALIYLGVISSGLCFYLWNKGSRLVNASTLAVMNNGYLPLAVIFSITIFSEQANVERLLLGGVFIVGSIYLAQQQSNNAIKKLSK